MPPTVAVDAARVTPRIWPITALLVSIAFVLMLINGFIAGIVVAPFFGDHPSRDHYILAGMACITTLPVFAAMVWCGRERGSRHGVWLIGVPAAVMALSGLNLLFTTGGSDDPHPTRAPGPADLFADTTRLNWFTFVVFVGCGVAIHLLVRRARHTEKGSAA